MKGQHLSRKVKIRYRSCKRPQVINTAALAQCAAGPLDRNVRDPFAVPQLEVEAGLAVLQPFRCDRMQVTLAQQHVVLAADLDFGPILRIEQHSI